MPLVCDNQTLDLESQKNAALILQISRMIDVHEKSRFLFVAHCTCIHLPEMTKGSLLYNTLYSMCYFSVFNSTQLYSYY